MGKKLHNAVRFYIATVFLLALVPQLGNAEKALLNIDNGSDLALTADTELDSDVSIVGSLTSNGYSLTFLHAGTGNIRIAEILDPALLYIRASSTLTVTGSVYESVQVYEGVYDDGGEDDEVQEDAASSGSSNGSGGIYACHDEGALNYRDFGRSDPNLCEYVLVQEGSEQSDKVDEASGEVERDGDERASNQSEEINDPLINHGDENIRTGNQDIIEKQTSPSSASATEAKASEESAGDNSAIPENYPDEYVEGDNAVSQAAQLSQAPVENFWEILLFAFIMIMLLLFLFSRNNNKHLQ